MNKEHPLLSWQFLLLKLAVFGLVAVFLQQPAGSLKGRISLEMPGFHVQSYDISGHKVYAIASGSGDVSQVERGVWIKSDGTFAINQLPKGEYSLSVKAPGFQDFYKYGVFINDGQVTDAGNDLALIALHPDVRIGSNNRVFTTKEAPQFSVTASDADRITVKLYRFNALDLLSGLTKTPVKKAAKGPKVIPSVRQNLTADEVRALGLHSGSSLSIYKPYNGKSPLAALKTKPCQIMERSLQANGNNWNKPDFKLDKPLPPGDYLVTAEVSNLQGETDWNVYWFNVSDLGLLVKNDGKRVVARAVDLNTSKPQANALIEVYIKGCRQWLRAKTAANGFAEINFPQSLSDGAEKDSLVMGSLGQGHAYGEVWAGSRDNESYKTFCYTERPVYRLGQTVYFKTIVRAKENNAISNPGADLDVSVTVSDPDNNSIWQKQLTTDDHGAFWGTFAVPADAKTGAYQISMNYPDSTQYIQTFEVAEYRKPEYEVTVTPITPQVVAGQKGQVKVKASYYFGAPVANATVKYSIYSSADTEARYKLMPKPAYMTYYDDWADDQEGADQGYGGDYIGDGTAHTDQNGEAIIQFDTTRPVLNLESPSSAYTDQRYKIQAEVTDLSRMTVVGSGFCSAVIGDFEMFLQNKVYVLKAGDSFNPEVTALNRDGTPVVNQKISLALCRWPYDSVKGEYRPMVTVAKQEVTTDAQGKASVKFNTDKSLATDTYNVTALSADSGGRQIYATDSVWVASEEQPFYYFAKQAAKQTLSIKLDKSVYKVGETARAMITAPVTGKEGLDAIVAIEADSLIRYWTVPLDASAKLVEIPIQANFEPNVFFTVSFVGKGHQYYENSQMIKVSPDQHNLTLTVKAQQEKYKPGETANFTVKATLPNGLPAADTEVSLGLVDESVYAIRPDSTPDIVKTFYPRRNNTVVTSCTFPETYSGGPDKIEPRVRKNFKDTAQWLPNLKTDAQGIVVAHINLPDNLTTWRATVRGCTKENNFGSATGKIVTTQDLIVRLALPRFFTVGDEGFVSALVQNYTDRQQTVTLNLALSPSIQTSDKLTQKVVAAAKESVRYSWPVKITQPGVATISVKAVGQTAADAMQTKLPLDILGIPAFSAKSGVLTGDPEKVSIPWETIGASVPGSAKYKLTLAPSSIGPVLGNFDALIEYPYGCTEQTMSRLMPSVVALTLHKKLALPISANLTKKFAKVYKMAMDKLVSYQHSDGGWGWWQTDDSNLYLTALVLEGFKDLQSVDYAVDADKQKAGLQWLEKGSAELAAQLTKPQTKVDRYEENEHCIDLARACYVIALYGGQPEQTTLDFLRKRINTMTPEALAYLVMAEKTAGRQQAANNAYQRLLLLANKPQGMIDWEPTVEMNKKLGFASYGGWFSYRFTGVETSALALKAILAMEPKNSALIEPVKTWLLSQRTQDGWDNTKTTAQVFMALLQEQLNFAGGSIQAPAISVSDGEKLLDQMSWTASNLYGPEDVLKAPFSSQSKDLTLAKSGPGRVYYSSLLTYQRLLKPGEVMPGMTMPDGLKLERTFSRISVAATTSDGKMHFHATNLVQNTVHSGETILMKVKVTSPTSVPYVMLECALPSGAEVVKGDSKSNNLDNADDSQSTFEADWAPYWWTHQDVLDDRIVFFVTNLPAGKSEFPIMLRMEMPGVFQINPLKLEGMYTDKVRGYSSPGVITVTE